MLASDEDWFARSAEDFKRIRESGHSPLSNLTLEEFNEFLDSLIFRKGGVVSGCYKPLMSLPLTQVFEVFESFGVSREVLTQEPEEGHSRTLEYKEDGGCKFSFWDFCLEDKTV